jgi:hypothetical protein
MRCGAGGHENQRYRADKIRQSAGQSHSTR